MDTLASFTNSKLMVLSRLDENYLRISFSILLSNPGMKKMVPRSWDGLVFNNESTRLVSKGLDLMEGTTEGVAKVGGKQIND